jgi:uncharacterized protein (DUF486 family)
MVILASWGIAFFEYCFQVPANRYGYGQFTATQLKVMQEVITLIVFTCVAVLYLHETIRWNYIVGFLFLIGAVFFVFGFQPDKPKEHPAPTATAPDEGHSDQSSRT